MRESTTTKGVILISTPHLLFNTTERPTTLEPGNICPTEGFLTTEIVSTTLTSTPYLINIMPSTTQEPGSIGTTGTITTKLTLTPYLLINTSEHPTTLEPGTTTITFTPYLITTLEPGTVGHTEGAATTRLKVTPYKLVTISEASMTAPTAPYATLNQKLYFQRKRSKSLS